MQDNPLLRPRASALKVLLPASIGELAPFETMTVSMNGCTFLPCSGFMNWFSRSFQDGDVSYFRIVVLGGIVLWKLSKNKIKYKLKVEMVKCHDIYFQKGITNTLKTQGL